MSDLNKKQIKKLKDTISSLQQFVNSFKKNGLACEDEKKLKSGDPLNEIDCNGSTEFV